MLTVSTAGETVTIPDPVVATLLRDFTALNGTVGAVLPGSVSGGAWQLAPNSSTKAALANALVPPDPNRYYVLRTARAIPNLTLAGLTVVGTPQGHMYNGLMIDHCDGAQVTDCLFVAVPGNAPGPPGETFGVNVWGGTGVTLTGIEFDGAGVAASGIGVNSASDVTLVDCYVHDGLWGAPTFWQTVGVTTRRLVSRNNALGVNHERVTGPVRHYDLQCHVAAGVMHMNLHNDQADNPDVEVHLADWSGGKYGANSPFCLAMRDNYMGGPNRQVTVPRFYGPDGAPMQVADAGSPTHPAVNVAAALADPRHWVVRFR